MKIQGIVFALAFAINLMNASIASGQFKDAAVADMAVGVTPVFANNTGNYIYETGGVTYMVNVSDDANGNNSILSWKVGISTGILFIDPSADIVDPDVCLVKNGAGAVFAVVVYFDLNSNQFMMRSFSWVSGTQQFVPIFSPVTLAAGTYLNTIHIDANDVGDFAIVFDQPGQLIQLAFGSTVGSGPILTFPGNVFNLEAGTMPDVAFYRNSISNFKQVDVAYISANGLVTVDFYRFSDLLTGTVALQPAFRSAPADLIYRYPRIDCPAPGYGPALSFTVVVEDSDNLSSWYIKSFNANNCCPGFTTTIYNDGSTSNSPYNLTDVANTRPVVAYQNNGDGVIVGWNFDNLFGLLAAPGAGVAKYPIAMSCDKKAQIYPASSFLSVPLSIPFGSQISSLSISGRFASEGLFTYHNGPASDIYYKSVPHSVNAGNLRIENSNIDNFHQWLNEITLEKSASSVVFDAYDLLGKQVFHFNGAPGLLISQWNGFAEDAPSGIYAARSYNNEGISNFTGKILISN